MKSLGLYLHIPFCIKKCEYCDFYSVPNTSESLKDTYINALISHMKEYGPQARDYVVNSVYFGGGTPSLLTEKQLKLIMKNVKSCFNLSPLCEISMEVNPGTVDAEKLTSFRRCGINRLSIGVQSFNDEDLQTAGRIHTSGDAYKAISDARKAKFNNVSIDLIYGLPNQTLQNVVDNINIACGLEVDHLSLYGLKIEEGTPFWFNRYKLSFPDEETERSMYFTSVGLLEGAGFKQYEISNFAKKNKACRHNLKYWHAFEYLGLGPGAHSYFAGKRFSFKKSLSLYLDSFDPAKTTVEQLIDEYIDIPYSSRIAEYVMLNFRLNSGIDCQAFRKQFGQDFNKIYYERILPYLKSGHIVRTKNGYAFSLDGMYVSNYILSRVIDFDLIIPGTN